MPFPDAALFVLLLAGHLLALLVWWLFGAPFVKLRDWRGRARGEVASRDGVRNWIGSD